MRAARDIRSRIAPLEEKLKQRPGLWEMFEKCFMNTVETTVETGFGDTFIITGDIPAMWLRDSTAQVMHYMRFLNVQSVVEMIEGLILRQMSCLMHDPYANAFNKEASDYKPFDDEPKASEWVWERKYEIDSLCYPLWLAEKFVRGTNRTHIIGNMVVGGIITILNVFETELRHENSPYRFSRKNCPESDTLSNDGMGAPVGYTGMTWSGFRPSDDACKYGYLVPSNIFAVRALESAAFLANTMGETALMEKAVALRDTIKKGIEDYAVIDHPEFGKMYAYEVDGLGNYNLMDDANVPSLLSLPYLGTCPMDDEIYLNTRKFVLSRNNPYYFEGEKAKGIGSPHTPDGYVWPIALCMQAMTATDDNEIGGIVDMLLSTHADTGFMHESFDPNNPEKYTRSWFAWANSMFGELIMRLYEADKLDCLL